ncbi:uncharacterized protein Tco025E_09380, partial [Trypanosoma conorhini]
PAANKAAVLESSDDDDEPVRKPALKANALSAVKPAANKAAVLESSDDDDEPVRKPAPKANASSAVKPAANKAAVLESSDDDDEPVRKPGPKRARESEPSDEEGLVKKSIRTEKGSVVRQSKEWNNKDVVGGRSSNGKGGSVVRRFQRIDPTKVVFSQDELKDNRPGDEHMVLRQNQEMMRVKGKNFNKLKQKNKAKFYAAGVDTSVRAFQFDDSD